MHSKKTVLSMMTIIIMLFSSVAFSKVSDSHQPKNFSKVMIVIFENMSYAEIKNEPTFRRLVNYGGHELNASGKLQKTANKLTNRDVFGNGYAFFSRYYNNHVGGTSPVRPSQPNYIAMTSGSIHNIKDDENHNLNVDNLAIEATQAGVTWKVYAENLPEFKLAETYNKIVNVKDVNLDNYIKPYLFNAALSEEENDLAEHQYYLNNSKPVKNNSNNVTSTSCFLGYSYPSKDGYQRKHEPFISYTNIQKNNNLCRNIQNSSHLADDINNMPAISFYIPNQINDGHNGTPQTRLKNANAFLSRMLGTNAATGELLPNAMSAPFQKFMAQGGLLIITFDEPSLIGNPDKTIYTLLAGRMINSGSYPNKDGNHAPRCYPSIAEQRTYPRDAGGDYDVGRCNHYNLLKMIENNWSLRGLSQEHTSAGYKYAYPLDNGISEMWRAS